MGNGRDVLAGGEPQVELRKRDRMKATARRYVRVPLAVRTSDLPKRAASAAVMLAVAGGALWAGGIALTLFIVVVAAATYAELVRLVVPVAPALASARSPAVSSHSTALRSMPRARPYCPAPIA